MRVVVANLTSGGLSGGYRKYLARLMPLLAADPRVRQLTVFVPRTGATHLPGLDVRTYEPGNRFAGLVKDAAALRPDLVFVPTARWVDFGAIPTVTMIRNMEPLAAAFGDNPWGERIRNVARRWEARRSAARARRVIAVSKYVRDFIVVRWGIDPGRVGTVYHGVDPVDVSEPAGESVIFTAGSIRPARGLADLVDAVPLLGPEVSVVIAGGVDRGAERHAARLRHRLDQHGVTARVTWAGQLNDREMAAAFRRCALFVTTSRAEACPNTVLEAMSAGRAAVSVDGAPMPEFFGDAALYYRAGNASQFAAQVQRVLGDVNLRRRLEQAARMRASRFTWEATRDRTIDQLQEALS